MYLLNKHQVKRTEHIQITRHSRSRAPSGRRSDYILPFYFTILTSDLWLDTNLKLHSHVLCRDLIASLWKAGVGKWLISREEGEKCNFKNTIKLLYRVTGQDQTQSARCAQHLFSMFILHTTHTEQQTLCVLLAHTHCTCYSEKQQPMQ